MGRSRPHRYEKFSIQPKSRHAISDAFLSLWRRRSNGLSQFLQGCALVGSQAGEVSVKGLPFCGRTGIPFHKELCTSTRKNMTRKKSVRGAIPIRAVDFVMYCAGHPKKTRAWYQKIFGFSPGEEWNEFWSEFRTEPVTFCLNGPSRRGAKWNWDRPPAVAFAVSDIHEAAAICRKRKIPVLKGPIETSVCWMLFISDPEGNRIVLHQRKDGTAG